MTQLTSNGKVPEMQFSYIPRIYYRCHHCAEDIKRYIECRYGDDIRFAIVDDGSEAFNFIWFIFACRLEYPLNMKLYHLFQTLGCLPKDVPPAHPGAVTANLTWLTLSETEKKIAAGALHRRVGPPGLLHPDYTKNAGKRGALSTQLELSPACSPDDPPEAKYSHTMVSRSFWQQDMEYKCAAKEAKQYF